ncbi:MAG: NVEALA domain-containing protein [Proteiniphilum sp.]|nr:NVEALA domain-containing protein [Proteiniphilum sp.]MDD4800393.1 NVEALA domain-containing protein [Proteiniphilum sp.]
MKKNIVSSFLAISLVIASFFYCKINLNKLNFSNLTLNNIEALAQGEIIIEIPFMLIWPMPFCQYHPDEGIIRFGVAYQ